MISNFVRRHTSCEVKCPTLCLPVIKITYVSSSAIETRACPTQSKFYDPEDSIYRPRRCKIIGIQPLQTQARARSIKNEGYSICCRTESNKIFSLIE